MKKDILISTNDIQIPGKIIEIRTKSVSIQTINDGECFFIVPKSRIPQTFLSVGRIVTIVMTTRYGHFGIISDIKKESNNVY